MTPAANTSSGPLVSHRLRPAGRPHYLIETAEGLVPVDLKPARVPGLDRMPLIRGNRGSANVHRQHQHIGRCRKCGYRSVCEDAMS